MVPGLAGLSVPRAAEEELRPGREVVMRMTLSRDSATLNLAPSQPTVSSIATLHYYCKSSCIFFLPIGHTHSLNSFWLEEIFQGSLSAEETQTAPRRKLNSSILPVARTAPSPAGRSKTWTGPGPATLYVQALFAVGGPHTLPKKPVRRSLGMR